MKAVIEGFNKANPNITINQTVVPYDDYQTKIAASVPAGTGPDVAMSYFGWIPLWAKQGFIVPLPDSVAKEVGSASLSPLRRSPKLMASSIRY